MTHLNMTDGRGKKNTVFGECIALTARYQCGCTGGEVVTVSFLVPKDEDEDRIVETLRLMVRDLKFEIEQHLKK